VLDSADGQKKNKQEIRKRIAKSIVGTMAVQKMKTSGQNYLYGSKEET